RGGFTSVRRERCIMIRAGSRFGVLGVAILAAALAAFVASAARADLFVSRDSPNGTVLQYDESTGALIADFGADMVGNARGVLWGPDGNLYVASDAQNAILRFDANGKFVDTFIKSSGELSGPRGLIFDTKGNLYVSSKLTNSVERYDPKGKYLGSFVPKGSGGLSGARGVLFRPHGNLYLARDATGQTPPADGTPGRFLT